MIIKKWAGVLPIARLAVVMQNIRGQGHSFFVGLVGEEGCGSFLPARAPAGQSQPCFPDTGTSLPGQQRRSAASCWRPPRGSALTMVVAGTIVAIRQPLRIRWSRTGTIRRQIVGDGASFRAGLRE